MNARNTIQRIIDAQQSHDTIEYGIRSIRTCGSWYSCSGPHFAQLRRACSEGGRLLGRPSPIQGDNGTLPLLIEAKKRARAELDAAKQAKRDFGGVRQLRLALAEAAEAVAA